MFTHYQLVWYSCVIEAGLIQVSHVAILLDIPHLRKQRMTRSLWIWLGRVTYFSDNNELPKGSVCFRDLKITLWDSHLGHKKERMCFLFLPCSSAKPSCCLLRRGKPLLVRKNTANWQESTARNGASVPRPLLGFPDLKCFWGFMHLCPFCNLAVQQFLRCSEFVSLSYSLAAAGFMSHGD